ncbi:MAG: Uncharacterised protein [Formosa sp. Hel1_33_131]|nr:MAG: Uncharacterised protein [Formosa sp. Hel1_33_131]|tara:strand:+ start:19307 stop:19987 length:681 start_codon:yes stop_codon:yes gene_type:complete
MLSKTINLKTQIIKSNPAKSLNALIFGVFFLFFCLSVKGQIYIEEGVLITLEKVSTIIVSGESNNQINSSIEGKGVFIFNSKCPQQLNSSQALLILPNLCFKNANLAHIETSLEIVNNLIIEQGTLLLHNDLHLQDSNSLLTFGNGKVLYTIHGQLIYNLQFRSNNTLLVLLLSKSLISNVITSINTIEFAEWSITSRAIDMYMLSYESLYMSQLIPPPRIFNTFS